MVRQINAQNLFFISQKQGLGIFWHLAYWLFRRLDKMKKIHLSGQVSPSFLLDGIQRSFHLLHKLRPMKAKVIKGAGFNQGLNRLFNQGVFIDIKGPQPDRSYLMP